MREAGGFQIDTVAEDADLTMALLRNGHRVEYEDQALAFTEAPTTANALMRQRFRWSFGILQSIWKHSAVFARKGVLGFVALPNILVFQILLPLVSPFIDIMFAVGTIWYFTRKYYHPDSTDPADFQRLLIFFVAFLVIDFIASAIAFALERRQPESPRRHLAPKPGLAPALRLPPGVFHSPVPHLKASHNRTPLRVGQVRSHRRRKVRARRAQRLR